MKPIEVVPVPFYMVSMDVLGPLKTTPRGNQYILTIVDYFTKYVEAYLYLIRRQRQSVDALKIFVHDMVFHRLS